MGDKQGRSWWWGGMDGAAARDGRVQGAANGSKLKTLI